MGHCSNEYLAMALTHGKAHQAVAEAAQHRARPSCASNERPRLAKPSKAPTTHEFNDVIGMGICFSLGQENTTNATVLNMVCHSTAHHIAVPLPSRHGRRMRRRDRALRKR
eukprot:7547340-Pyramimonas_sp.AAC.1